MAGARLPKGAVEGELLPDSARVGVILRAEARPSLDGLQIVAVSEPKIDEEPTDRLRLIRRSATGPLVNTSLVSSPKRRRDADGDGGRGRRHSGKGGASTRTRRESRSRGRGGGAGNNKQDRRRASQDRGPRERKRQQQRQPARSRPKEGSSGRRTRPRVPRLKPKWTHREAALNTIPQLQQPLAREVLRGGVPGVRRTIRRMNKRAAKEKLPPITAEPLVALAETMAPRLKAAEWHDRAEAALDGIDTVDLRDLRSVVAAADQAARTKQTRSLAESIRAGLARRQESDHRQWLVDLAIAIREGRTVRALRLSSRPPKAGAPLPPDIAESLAALASADLDADTPPRRWVTLLDAVAYSPVRVRVKPAGVPSDPGDELLARVRKTARQTPHIAARFGVQVGSGSPARRPPQALRPPPPARPPAEGAPAKTASQPPDG